MSPPWRKRFISLAIVCVVCLFFYVAVVLPFEARYPQWQASVVSDRPVAGGLRLRNIAFRRGHQGFEAWCLVGEQNDFSVRLREVREVDGPQLKACLSLGFIAAINGGYFDSKFRPAGVLRIDGMTRSSPATGPAYSACLIVDSAGRLTVTHAGDSSVDHAFAARQCGPYLIENGIRSVGTKTGTAAQRTAIAEGGGRMAWIITGPASLFDVARLLETHPEAFGITRVHQAVNLDGGPSSGLVVSGLLDKEPAGRITDVIVLRRAD